MIPFWDRDRLRQQMRPVDFSGKAKLSEIEQQYCAYYRIDKESRISGVTHRLGYFEALDYRLALHVYTPPRPKGTVFVFHGYFDHVGLYGHLIEYLLRQSFSVVAYDLPGHGLSSGDPVSIKSFSDYQGILKACLEVCEGNLAGPWFAVGQSTGAAVLIETLFHFRYTLEDSPFKHWVLLAPLVRPKGWRQVVLLHAIVGGFIRTWRRGFSTNSHDSEFVRFLKEKDPLQSQFIAVDWVSALRKWVAAIEMKDPLPMPATIIQGQEDATVDWQHNVAKLQTLLPNATVTFLKRARHQLVNEAPDLRNQVFERIGNALSASLESLNSASVQEK